MSVTKAKYQNGIETRYDSSSRETVAALAPVTLYDDFIGKAIDTTILWTALDTSSAGDTAPILVEDGNSGVAQVMLDATSEAQLSGLYAGDKRNWILNQGLNFEARVTVSVLPTTGSIICIGLMGDHNATVDTVAESIWFRLDGATGGLVTVENDDTSNETTKVTTGITLTASDTVILRIDCSDITDIKFYMDGVRVASGTTFTMATVAGLKLQPIIRASKASGTSVGTVLTDFVRLWQKRS